MKEIKVEDIVARKSYGKDILFRVKRIINTSKGEIAILAGVIERIEADSPIQDLEKIDEKIINKNIEEINKKIEKRIEQYKNREYEISIVSTNNKRMQKRFITGKILHLDGDSCLDNKNSLLT